MMKCNHFKRNGLILSIFLFSILTTVLIQPSEVENKILEEKDESQIFKEIKPTYTPKTSGDATTYYEYNKFTFKNTQFTSGLEGWTASSGTGSTVTVTSGICELQMNYVFGSDEFEPYIVYDPEPFLKGEIYINWYKTNLESGDYLEIRYTTGSNWDTATTLAQCSFSSMSSQTIALNDVTHGTNNDDFKIAIYLNSQVSFTDNDYGYVDFIELKTWEFIVTEEISDPIPQQTSQQISAYVYNAKTGRTNLELQYKLNDGDLSPSPISIAYNTPQSGNSFIFDIPNTIYDYNDIFYYDIYTAGNDGSPWTATSAIYEFDCIDTTDPVFANRQVTGTPVYNQNVECSVDCSEISGDSNINSIDMYVKNGSAATISDFNIKSNEQASLPVQSDTFHFIIPHNILDYSQTLHYLIRAYDISGNSNDFTGSFSVDDSTKPTYQFISINTTTPEFNKSVKVLYNIAEPSDASGFATDLTNIKLRYKNGSQPININDYTGEVSSDNTSVSVIGGNIEFIIPNSEHFYGEFIYYFIYFADNELNYENSLSEIKSFQIKGIDAIFILPLEASGGINYYYNTPYINLSFTSNNDCNLWYKIDSNTPSTPIYGNSLNTMLTLSEGAHTITAYCGYETNSKSYTIFIDTIPNSPLVATISKTGNNIRITWNEPEGYDELTYYEIWRKDKDSAEFIKIADEITNLFYYDDDLKTGSYEYKIVSVDRAENRSEFSSIVNTNISTPVYFYFIIIGAIIGGVISIVKFKGRVQLNQKSREFSETKMDFDVIDDFSDRLDNNMELNEDFNRLTKVTENAKIQMGKPPKTDETNWKDLSWKSKDNSENKYDLKNKQVKKAYWNSTMRKLIEKGMKLELNGNFRHAIKNYQMALRCSENYPGTDNDLVTFLKIKTKSISSNPLTYLDE